MELQPPWSSMDLHGGLYGAPTSMETSTELHEPLWRPPWSSTDLHGDLHEPPWRLPWSLHGPPWRWRSPWSFMSLHGVPDNVGDPSWGPPCTSDPAPNHHFSIKAGLRGEVETKKKTSACCKTFHFLFRAFDRRRCHPEKCHDDHRNNAW